MYLLMLYNRGQNLFQGVFLSLLSLNVHYFLRFYFILEERYEETINIENLRE